MARKMIFTRGYWPLPVFKSAYANGKWHAAASRKTSPKEASMELPKRLSGVVVLEARIGKALSKKICLKSGGKNILFSRWFGGLYSNASTRSPSQVREYYNAIAARYEHNTEPEREKQLETIAIHLKKILPKNASVLDASAGRCLFARVAKKHGLVVTSMDISEKMLSSNGWRGKKVLGSITRPPFAKGSFDCVVHLFSNLLSYDRKAFPAFHSMLAKGGVLVYLPVKSPGEQWLPGWREKAMARLEGSGFEKMEKISIPSIGRKKSVLTFIQARKKA
ncbi:MAG: methyltransferase domain-containing protein [Candidatus Micrarchaeia archaeon]